LRPRILLLWLLLAACASGVHAQAQAPALLHKDLREEVLRIPARAVDAAGREIAGHLPVTLYRPQGPGPFPLLIISHGRDSAKRADMPRPRFESAARFFVRKGFAVAAPLRLGYGELASLGDPEAMLSCNAPRYAAALAAAAGEIVTVARALAQLPDIDPARLVLVGQSVGGVATIAATSLKPAGLIAAINFAGGHGGNPNERRGEPCRPEALRELARQYGESNARAMLPTPTLWVYAENDRFFSPVHGRRWAEAYRSGGGLAELQLLPPFGEDGHKLFAQGNDIWQPLVDAFLARHGFEQPGTLSAPAASGFAALDDSAALPRPAPAVKAAYLKFLDAATPRAFALNNWGNWGYAVGDDALSRALSFCQRSTGLPCRFYAVNDQVVWSPTP